MTDRELDAQIAAKLGWRRVTPTIAVPSINGWGVDLPSPDRGPRMPGEDEWEGSEAIFGYRLRVSRAYPCGSGWFEPTRSELQARIVRDVISHNEAPSKHELIGMSLTAKRRMELEGL